jgi:hypothetical protein
MGNKKCAYSIGYLLLKCAVVLALKLYHHISYRCSPKAGNLPEK